MFDIGTFPTNPGCYLFQNTSKKIIYVGKAKNLRKRIRSYFQKKQIDPKTSNLIKSIASISFIVTDTEVEALILENTLIKKHQPKYNINLKDAKTYAYIHLTDEQFPRLSIARQKKANGIYFGPFVSALERDHVLQFLTRTFSLRTCKKLPKKPCLRFHLKLCNAPCIGEISKEDYDKKIRNVRFILSGKSKELQKKLKKEMTRKSQRYDFEGALIIRDQLIAIEHLQEHQKMQRQRTFNEDIINYLLIDEQVYLMLFNIYKGTLSTKNEFIFGYTPDFLEEFIVQYYSENPIPKEVIVPQRLSESITVFLSQKRKKKVRIILPKKGEKKQLLDLVAKNIESTFFGDMTKVEELKHKLHLQESPTIIECFDISHLSGTLMVGSMVQFRNGKADKSNYRRFRIRTLESIDDVAAIAEVVRRRYTRLQQEHTALPQLIIIDGGIGQLNAAVCELEKIDLKIPILSIAKQFEEIYLPGFPEPLHLGKKEKALLFIREIRDEAHRFAIAYNRLLRKKELRT
ncbi:excinuclease ABC subunit C [Thermoplasmatales archaeon SM1-50]|nr:MAG: excinuclease ABC subunit C [Thermoplasmatales archaeon SM1-50]